jgi:magnesium transporter
MREWLTRVAQGQGGTLMSHAIFLFEGQQTEILEDLSERPKRLARSQLLWVDLDGATEEGAREVVKAFELEEETFEFLTQPQEHAEFKDYGRYLHLTTYAPREDDEGKLHALECVVGANWVVTAHDLPIPVLDDFAARASGSGDTGSLDGPGFLAALLEWVLGSYTRAFEQIEQDLEDFDVQAMRGRGSDDDIETLVGMRRQIGVLRRALAAHRFALVALSHPELEALGDNASSERFATLFKRFESTVQEARDSRESVVGSFDVLIARAGHHTNRIMKVLTLVSVILLPGTLVAGVMGMNFKVGLFQHEWLFWVILAAIAGVAPLTIGAAKTRKWI